MRSVLITRAPFYILGDFNLPNINWAIPNNHGNSAHAEFLNFCCSNSLSQCIDYPTHDRGNILDLLICTYTAKNILINHSSNTPPWHTDHFLISINLSFSPSRSSTTICTYPNFRAANYEAINSELSLVNWDGIFTPYIVNVPDTYDYFLSILNSSIAKHTPIKVKKPGKPLKKPHNIRKLLKEKHKIYKQCKTNPLKKAAYKTISKAYDLAVDEWNDRLESNICSNPSSKKFYSYANKKLNTSNFIPPLQDSSGKLILSDMDKANHLNIAFQSYFSKDDFMPFFCRNQAPARMPNFEITCSDIIIACKQMKNKLSRTPDGIPSLFIKKTINSILKPLCSIFNLSLKCNSIPSQWKCAYVTPIFKKGDRRNPTNYRPISLTSSFCRLFEAIVSEKIMQHLLSLNLLSSSQFGFVPNRSSCGQLLTCLHKWYFSFFDNHTTSVLYTDISKAFDSVNHRFLVKILESYGISHELVSWIRNFLNKRFQKVCIGSSMSEPLEVYSGVPQGSVIGPLLFIIFINNIVSCVDNSSVDITMFADDTKLFSTCPIKLQQGIDSGATWLLNHKLKLASHKCHILQISKQHISDHSQFKIGTDPVQSKLAIKDLGVYVSHDLKWASHINYIYNNAAQYSYQILKTFRSKNIWTYKKLLLTYIRPKLEYNTPVWSPHLKKDVDKIERIQRYYTKRVFFRCNISFDSYKDRLNILNIKSLEHRRIQFDLIMLYKIIHGLSNLNFHDFFVYRTHSHNLRGNSHKIDTIQKHSSSHWSNTFFARVVRYWNLLPDDIASSFTLPTFKSRLKNFDMSLMCPVEK